MTTPPSREGAALTGPRVAFIKHVLLDEENLKLDDDLVLLCDSHQALRARVEAAEAQVRALEGALRRLEWSKTDDFDAHMCPACEAWEDSQAGHRQHAPDCWLAAALQRHTPQGGT